MGTASLYGSTKTYPNFLEEVRAEFPDLVYTAERRGDMPPLFNGGPDDGDLPLETASGIDPYSLRDLGWRGKLVVAYCADRAKAVSMLQRFGDPDGEAYAEAHHGRMDRIADMMTDVWQAIREAAGGSPEYQDAIHRATFVAPTKIMASADSTADYAALFGPQPSTVAASTDDPDYVALFGVQARRVAASADSALAEYRLLYGVGK